jgi:hypothetical protein
MEADMGASAAEIANEVSEQIRTLVGREVRGLGNGCERCDILVLQFSNMTPPYSSGEYALFVDCAWRLEREGNVLAGSHDRAPNKGHASILSGQKLVLARVLPPALDVTLQFSGGIVLHLFTTCNDVTVEDEFTHWRLYGPARYYLGAGPGMTYSVQSPSQGGKDASR